MKISSQYLAGLLAIAIEFYAAPFAMSLNSEGLTANWNMDVESGMDVPDASGNQLNGTCGTETAACSVPGKVGKAIRFPEAGTISLDRHSAKLGKLTDFSISMWICYDGGPSRQLFTFSDGSLNHRIQVEVHNGQLGFGWQNGGSFNSFVTKPLTWTTGVWYHVVFVNDHKVGKSILRSNDLVWETDASTLSPADLALPVKRVSIGSLNGEYRFNGIIDDVQLYNRALSLQEQLTIGEAVAGNAGDPARIAARKELINRHFRTRAASKALEQFLAEESTRLSMPELQRKAEWLFQAEQEDLLSRAGKEIAWASELVDRLQKRTNAPDMSAEKAALAAIRQEFPSAGQDFDHVKAQALYFRVRELKRRTMFKYPEVNFSKIVCVDAPYTHRSPETHGTYHQTEWIHESRFRSEMCATHGARLLVLENFAGDPVIRQIGPPEGFGRQVAMFSFDLSFDGKRAVFCMKPEDEKAYHLYETGVDGKGFRQITSGGYSDLDPIYLPNNRYLFLSTRAEVYAQCGMWARSYIMTRCDSNGSNIYILTPGTEPEFSPSLMDDGRVLSTRWEYVDKFANRIQGLWTMRPDGTAAYTFWGNQSVIPDHLGEGRQVPGTRKVMFTGFGHHDVWAGSIGIVDPKIGLNFPDGIWKITQERPWPEVGDGPVPTPGVTTNYHTSGKYAAYKTPYPLSEELFLVSARTGDLGGGFMHSAGDKTIGKFKLFLMDIYGNRELLYQGSNNVLYAQPVRPRKTPPFLPDLADMPGSEKTNPVIRPGILYSRNIFENAPQAIREHGRYLRIVESMPKNYSIGIVHSGGKPFGDDGPDLAWGEWGVKHFKGKKPMPSTDISWGGDSTVWSGPATSLTGPLGVKQVHGTVPINRDGSVCFKAPPSRMLYFQVLDEHYRAIHTMRSWVSVRPGEYRGCVGCHELHNSTYASQPTVSGTRPDSIQPPPWGVRSLSFVKDIQPVFDRACAECHTGKGPAAGKLNLALRPDKQKRWGGIFAEPYITLLLGGDNSKVTSNCPGFDGRNNYVAVPSTISTRYDTLPPMTFLSPRSRLITEVMDRKRCGKNIRPEELQMLNAWIDLWAMYRSDEECRAIEDPPAEWFPLWAYPPKTRGAPRVRTEYSQDEYRTFEDRIPGTNR